MKLTVGVGVLAALCATVPIPTTAQWLHRPTPGIARTSDGKPNLSAPAPRTPDGKPDLSGIWRTNAGGYRSDIADDLARTDIKPWADALYKQHVDTFGTADPATFECLPPGPAAHFNLNVGAAKIVQTPGLIVILYETLAYRQIFLDGRELPRDPNPSFMGYSVAHWDGDTLVVQSTGFNARTWLDQGGRVHTEALRLTERFRRTDLGHMRIEETIDDPDAYGKPWTVAITAELAPDTEMLEYICNENEKDHEHFVGKISDTDKLGVPVSPEVLSRYVGTYDAYFPGGDSLHMVWNVILADGELFIDQSGKNRRRMIPLSETTFSVHGFRVEFMRNEKGEVTHLSTVVAEGEIQAKRRPQK